MIECLEYALITHVYLLTHRKSDGDGVIFVGFASGGRRYEHALLILYALVVIFVAGEEGVQLGRIVGHLAAVDVRFKYHGGSVVTTSGLSFYRTVRPVGLRCYLFRPQLGLRVTCLGLGKKKRLHKDNSHNMIAFRFYLMSCLGSFLDFEDGMVKHSGPKAFLKFFPSTTFLPKAKK